MGLSCLRLSPLATAAIPGHGLVGKHTASLLPSQHKRDGPKILLQPCLIDRVTLEASGRSIWGQRSCSSLPPLLLSSLSSSCPPLWTTVCLMSVYPNVHVPHPYAQQTISQEGVRPLCLDGKDFIVLNWPQLICSCQK